jgi:hypothetical protein
MRTQAAVLALLMLPAAACDDSPPRPPASLASTPPATLAPDPLRLPSVAAGTGCPTTRPRSWSGPGVATAVLGDGPLYPVADYFQDGTVLELREQDRQPDGSLVHHPRVGGREAADAPEVPPGHRPARLTR